MRLNKVQWAAVECWKAELEARFPEDLAVIDPPWYNDFYKLFIWGALERLKPGGSMLMSFPPEGTRPSAANDLKEVIRWSQNAGAELIEHCPGILLRDTMVHVQKPAVRL